MDTGSQGTHRCLEVVSGILSIAYFLACVCLLLKYLLITTCNTIVYVLIILGGGVYYSFQKDFTVFLAGGSHLWHMEVPRATTGIRAAAAGLHYSHSNSGSESHLPPTPQLTATPDP